MSLLINDEIIWISVPRCASNSVETAMYQSSIKIEHFDLSYKNLKPRDKYFFHQHVNLFNLRERWGEKKTLRIKRDWFERWISALSHMWFAIEEAGAKPIINFKDIDNNFIYETFTKEFSNILYCDGGQYKIFEKLVKNYQIPHESKARTAASLFWSQNYWLSGEKKCDYEFDIKNLSEFENFIFNRYGVNIKLVHHNKSRYKINNLVIDENLKNHIWEIFEKPFVKKKEII